MVAINGTDLIPQPSMARWGQNVIRGKLNGTDSLSSYRSLVLQCPINQGGIANFNWQSFENGELTSVTVNAPGQTVNSNSEVTYNSGVVSKAIKEIANKNPSVIDTIEMILWVIV